MTTGKIGGFWDDMQCLETHSFVCEKPRPDISPPTKAPTPPPSQGCADGWTAKPHFRHCYKASFVIITTEILTGDHGVSGLCFLIHCSSSTKWTGP